MEFSRQEYWSGLPFPSPGDLPDFVWQEGPSELKLAGSNMQGRAFQVEATASAKVLGQEGSKVKQPVAWSGAS